MTLNANEKRYGLNLGGSVYNPTDPIGRLLFNVPGTIAEFEADLIQARTRERMAVAKAGVEGSGPCCCFDRSVQPPLHSLLLRDDSVDANV